MMAAAMPSSSNGGGGSAGTIMTNYRIIESKPNGNFSTFRMAQNEKSTNLSCTSSSASTIVEELILGENEIVMVRIHQMNVELPKSLLETTYQLLRKLEIKCYFEPDTVFRLISALKSLKVLRFGASSFVGKAPGASPPASCRTKIEPTSSVQEFIMSFNAPQYGSLEHNVRVEIGARILKVLNYATKYLPGLQKADLTLPLHADLDPFLACFPGLKANGRKIEDYINQIVAFKSGYFIQPTTTTMNNNNKRRMASGDSVSAAGPTKQSGSVTSEVSDIIDLTDDDDLAKQ